jgi:HEAT repeat protein
MKWNVMTGSLIAVFVFVGCTKQPYYEGRSMDSWLDDLEPGNPSETRDASKSAIQQLGTNALPCLLEQMHKFSKLTQKDFSNDVTLLDRWAAVRAAFNILGPAAAPAVPVLRDSMRGNDRQGCLAAELLISMGSNALPTILTAQTNAPLAVRICIVDHISELGSLASNAIPGLIECLKYGAPKNDDTMQLRGYSANTLGTLKMQPQFVVPALIQSVMSDYNVVRFEAARSLGKFGSNAVSAIPALTDATKDPDYHVSGVAVESLKEIEAASAPVQK